MSVKLHFDQLKIEMKNVCSSLDSVEVNDSVDVLSDHNDDDGVTKTDQKRSQTVTLFEEAKLLFKITVPQGARTVKDIVEDEYQR